MEGWKAAKLFRKVLVDFVGGKRERVGLRIGWNIETGAVGGRKGGMGAYRFWRRDWVDAMAAGAAKREKVGWWARTGRTLAIGLCFILVSSYNDLRRRAEC